jgi:hypothetical protein
MKDHGAIATSPRTLLISRDGTIATIEGSAEMGDLKKMVRSATRRDAMGITASAYDRSLRRPRYDWPALLALS